MANYIDGFVHPVPRKHLDEYQKVAIEVAKIWKEYGALDYQEFVGDDMHLDGTVAFPKIMNTNEDEVVLFGWVVFESKESRDKANAEDIPPAPRTSQREAPTIEGTFIRNMSSGPGRSFLW